jgi:Zn-dependent protease with chaperone function
MVVAYLMNPRLVVSRAVMGALSEEQKEAALRHEAAHRAYHDNARKLLSLLSPDILPFVQALPSLQREWVKFTEWAADDEAADGDAQRAGIARVGAGSSGSDERSARSGLRAGVASGRRS